MFLDQTKRKCLLSNEQLFNALCFYWATSLKLHICLFIFGRNGRIYRKFADFFLYRIIHVQWTRSKLLDFLTLTATARMQTFRKL